MIEAWLKGYLAGIFTIMTLVMIHHIVSERRKRRQLEMYGKILGLRRKDGESDFDYHWRVRHWMDTPGHPDSEP